MHPGWFVFFCAFGSGIFTLAAMLATVQWAMLLMPVGFVLSATTIAIALFVIGGRKAEKLWERE